MFVAEYYYRELGIKMPNMEHYEIELVKYLHEHFKIIDVPENNCLVYMRNKTGLTDHCGIWYDGYIFHNSGSNTSKGSVIASTVQAIRTTYDLRYGKWLR